MRLKNCIRAFHCVTTIMYYSDYADSVCIHYTYCLFTHIYTNSFYIENVCIDIFMQEFPLRERANHVPGACVRGRDDFSIVFLSTSVYV